MDLAVPAEKLDGLCLHGPAVLFLGVSTAASAVHRYFPRWSRPALGHAGRNQRPAPHNIRDLLAYATDPLSARAAAADMSLGRSGGETICFGAGGAAVALVAALTLPGTELTRDTGPAPHARCRAPGDERSSTRVGSARRSKIIPHTRATW